MPENTVEKIFKTKQGLADFYPNFPNVKTFDLHQKHLLYGRKPFTVAIRKLMKPLILFVMLLAT